MVSAHALVAVQGLAFGLVWSLTAKTALLRVAPVSQVPWFPVLLEVKGVQEAPSVLDPVADGGG